MHASLSGIDSLSPAISMEPDDVHMLKKLA